MSQDAFVGQACDVSVIVPLVDQRVIGVDESVRSWAHNQTLPKDRYEVIVVSDGSNPNWDAQAQQFLGPRVRLLRQQGANIAQLLDLGVRSALGTFALVTELHCEADPHCLAELLRFLDEHPRLQGVCIADTGAFINSIGEAECRLCNGYLEVWRQPDHWRKVQIRGFAIRRDVYQEVGGFDGRYPRFGESLLAAKLHDRGIRLGYAERALVTHYYSATFAQFWEAMYSRVADEYRYRRDHADEFCERYFGLWPAQIGPQGSASFIKKWWLRLRVWRACLRCWRNRKRTAELVTAYQNAYAALESFYRANPVRATISPTARVIRKAA